MYYLKNWSGAAFFPSYQVLLYITCIYRGKYKIGKWRDEVLFCLIYALDYFFTFSSQRHAWKFFHKKTSSKIGMKMKFSNWLLILVMYVRVYIYLTFEKFKWKANWMKVESNPWCICLDHLIVIVNSFNLLLKCKSIYLLVHVIEYFMIVE